MSTATMTADELRALSVALDRLRDEITESPEWCETTPLGLLADADYETLCAAIRVVHRLALDRKYPNVSRDTSYLPEPTPEPQPLRA